MGFIAEKLRAGGLEIREYPHGTDLVELVITNPADSGKGRVDVGYDGYVKWEYEGQIKDRPGAQKIVETVVSVLTTDVAERREQMTDDNTGS